jgi:putative RecB family exonuclease
MQEAPQVKDVSGAGGEPKGEPGPVALSPSRVSDFKNCPQMYKYRVIDQLPEPDDIYSTRGTLVHAVLEALFRLPPQNRTLPEVARHLQEKWDELKALDEFASLDLPPREEVDWLAQTLQLLLNLFEIEDPASVSPEQLEWWVEHKGDRTFLRGIIDRVEIRPDGDWILSDYKTGRSPSENYALGSFFGLKFYALVCWRAFGKLPAELRLIQLKEPEVISLAPTSQMLEGLERQLGAIAAAITRALETDDWRPRPGRLCAWCAFQSICPAFPGADVAAGSAVQSSRS